MFIFCICLFTLVLFTFTFRLLVYGLSEYTGSLDSGLNCKAIFVFIHIFSVEQSPNMINIMTAAKSLLLSSNDDGNFDRQNWSKPHSARQNSHGQVYYCVNGFNFC